MKRIEGDIKYLDSKLSSEVSNVSFLLSKLAEKQEKLKINEGA